MTTGISMWGNSLAVRIPRDVAERAGVSAGDTVSLEVGPDGAVVIRRTRPRHSLSDLVKRITARNRHRETDWGAPRGRETW